MTMQNKIPQGSIGAIMGKAHGLNEEQLVNISNYQAEKKVKFGEAAVALGYVKHGDVVWALAQQFQYPYVVDKSELLSDELVVARNPFGDAAEAFRNIRSNLLDGILSPHNLPRRALAVISQNVGDGKTFFIANLAVALSQLGARTLLVDADMRSPRLHEIFKIDSTTGLSSILAGRSEANIIRPIEEIGSLYVLPVGIVPPNPLELVQRKEFPAFLAELSAKFDYVLVDTPAMAHGSDAKVIGLQCGRSVVLANSNSSRIKDLKALVGALSKNGSQCAGIIKNR